MCQFLKGLILRKESSKLLVYVYLCITVYLYLYISICYCITVFFADIGYLVKILSNH